MQLWMRKCLAAVMVAGAVSPFFSTGVKAEEKVQKIRFVEDDAQKYMASKIYTLKYIKAADIMPFVQEAVLRYTTDSKVSSVNDTANKRQLLIVSTGIDFFPYLDAMIKVLDRPSKINTYGSSVDGDGVATGFYRAKFRANADMLNVITQGEVFSGITDGVIKLDPVTGLFYFKDTPAVVQDIKNHLAKLDRPIPQVRLELTISEVRDSDMRDIGIDYLAWKNGPGMNLFAVGYNALNAKVGEYLAEQIFGKGMEVISNFTYGFGGIYTAPAFDASFIRLLQQNGRATISSTASVTLSNTPGEYSVSFAPEYQNITKNDKHASSVDISADAEISANFTDIVITGGKNGVVNFTYSLVGSNVVERNNMGAEIRESSTISSSNALAMGQETVLASWNKTSRVDQTIGVPVLCELPVLKYIFGTTTTNIEKTHFIVTVRAVPVRINDTMKPGVVAEFKDVCKK